MNSNRMRTLLLILGVLSMSLGTAFGVQFNWQVVVNNGVTVPGDSRNFNSYNQPSVNRAGLVVIRARSKGGSTGEPAHGIFTRDMVSKGPLVTIFNRTSLVPYPDDLDATFTEPPSFPRIDMDSNTIVSRGNHQPVWEYAIADGTESRAGTTGIYTNPFGSLLTGASNLGAVTGFERFGVPGMGSPTKFDVFPGAPSVTIGKVGSGKSMTNFKTIVFKGNYTDGTQSRTGVYYRQLADEPAGGTGNVVVIADNSTQIPGTTVKFGSTAPPSAAAGQAVFVGLDNENNPTTGGIYKAKLAGSYPNLARLVKIGDQVPGEPSGATFKLIGEGVSFDGRFVAFWGAWGSETKSLTLICPTSGNKVRIADCVAKYPNGFPVTVPLHQGIFVYDINKGKTWAVAKTPGDFDDFMYWNYSGMVPGMGEGEPDDTGEPAKWRSATFVAVSGLVDGSLTDANFHIAFKARKGSVTNATYVNPIDGLYMRSGPDDVPFTTVVETGMDGTLIDPGAVDPDTLEHLPVTAMGIERDGFRGNLLAIAVSMGAEEGSTTEAAGWAGIYLTKVPTVLSR